MRKFNSVIPALQHYHHYVKLVVNVLCLLLKQNKLKINLSIVKRNVAAVYEAILFPYLEIFILSLLLMFTIIVLISSFLLHFFSIPTFHFLTCRNLI